MLGSLVLFALALTAQGLRTASSSAGRAASRRESRSVLPQLRGLVQEAECSRLSEKFEDESSYQEPLGPQVPRTPYATNVPVFYIASGGTREESFIQMYQEFSPQFHRVGAINGSNLSQVAELITRPDETLAVLKARGTTPKVIGCLMSHLLAIHRAFVSGAEVALVLEDDAVPLVPWWPVSLEEYALSLPPKWHASQLQWSANLHKSEMIEAAGHDGNRSHRSVRQSFEDLLAQKRGNGSLFRQDTGWGTAAYLISRDGMKKVEGDIWDERAKRFGIFELLQLCQKSSADDCLLGFTDSLNVKTLKQVGMSATLKHSQMYKATPPFFMHGSMKKTVHRVNICLDFYTALTSQRPATSLTTTSESKRRQLLLWIPALLGEHKVRRLLRNIRHARNTAGADCCDIFPAFGTPHQPGQESEGAAAAQRFELLRQGHQSFGEAWAAKYEFLWMLDPFQDISLEDIDQVLRAVRESTALVAQPTASKGESLCRGQEAGCLYSPNATVTLTAPLIRTEVLGALLKHVTPEHEQGRPFDCLGASLTPDASPLEEGQLRLGPDAAEAAVTDLVRLPLDADGNGSWHVHGRRSGHAALSSPTGAFAQSKSKSPCVVLRARVARHSGSR